MKTIAVYAGSFDPMTYGHQDILYKAMETFDVVYAAVGNNPRKKHLFTLEERMDILQHADTGAKIVSFEGSLSRFCQKNKCTHIVRGLRSVTDYEYEIQLAAINKEYAYNVDTVFFIPDPEHLHISSSMVKELASLDENVEKFVGSYVSNLLRIKLGKDERQ